MAKFIKPEDREIGDKTFIISKFPAVQGREIVTQYPITGAPKIGEYKANQALMLKMMCFVAVVVESKGEEVIIPLITETLVNQHCGDWEVLAKLEMEIMQYNCSFFSPGKISGFFDSISPKVAAWITPILTDLLPQLSTQAEPHSGNSKKDTA